jgi:hypothetical protein
MENDDDHFDSVNRMAPPNHVGGRKNRGQNTSGKIGQYIGDGLDFGSSRSIEHQHFGKDAHEETSEFDVIGQDLAILMDEKLTATRFWANKLVQEMTSYVKALADVEVEYRRIQDLERSESERLDQVEPEVEEAVGQLLNVPQPSGIRIAQRRPTAAPHDSP